MEPERPFSRWVPLSHLPLKLGILKIYNIAIEASCLVPVRHEQLSNSREMLHFL